MTGPNRPNPENIPALSLVSISKSFGGRNILSDLSLTVAEKEFVVLLGASGSGKSTLLKLIAGLERPDQGELRIRGKDALRLQPADRDCAFSFQSNACYDHWTVQRNLYHAADPEMLAPLSEMIATMELQPILKSKPPQLSGGELGRVSLLRALASRKHFLLLDEPLAQMNPRFRAIAKQAIANVHRVRNHTTLYVTHDLNEAMLLADRIVLLKEGKVAGIANPRDTYESLLASSDEYVSAGVPRFHMAVHNGCVVLPKQWKIRSIRSSNSKEIAFEEASTGNHDPLQLECEQLECELIRCRWAAGYWELELSPPTHDTSVAESSIGYPSESKTWMVHVTETPWLPKNLATQLRNLEQGSRDEIKVCIVHDRELPSQTRLAD